MAARLTGWDLDILTPAEFAAGLETLEQTVRPIEGVEDEMLDRMGALGMISVFDVEEVGNSILEAELEMPVELAAKVVEICAEQAKVVAEQQQKEKEEAERKRLEEEATGAAILGGAPVETPANLDFQTDDDSEAAAAAILGGIGADTAPPVGGETEFGSASAPTVEIEAGEELKADGDEGQSEEPATATEENSASD